MPRETLSTASLFPTQIQQRSSISMCAQSLSLSQLGWELLTVCNVGEDKHLYSMIILKMELQTITKAKQF